MKIHDIRQYHYKLCFLNYLPMDSIPFCNFLSGGSISPVVDSHCSVLKPITVVFFWALFYPSFSFFFLIFPKQSFQSILVTLLLFIKCLKKKLLDRNSGILLLKTGWYRMSDHTIISEWDRRNLVCFSVSRSQFLHLTSEHKI